MGHSQRCETCWLELLVKMIAGVCACVLGGERLVATFEFALLFRSLTPQSSFSMLYAKASFRGLFSQGGCDLLKSRGQISPQLHRSVDNSKILTCMTRTMRRWLRRLIQTQRSSTRNVCAFMSSLFPILWSVRVHVMLRRVLFWPSPYCGPVKSG